MMFYIHTLTRCFVGVGLLMVVGAENEKLAEVKHKSLEGEVVTCHVTRTEDSNYQYYSLLAHRGKCHILITSHPLDQGCPIRRSQRYCG